MRATQFARVLVLDVSRGLERVGGAAHAAARRRRFASGNSHRKLQQQRPTAHQPSRARMGSGADTRKYAGAPAQKGRSHPARRANSSAAVGAVADRAGPAWSMLENEAF